MFEEGAVCQCVRVVAGLVLCGHATWRLEYVGKLVGVIGAVHLCEQGAVMDGGVKLKLSAIHSGGEGGQVLAH